MSEPNGAPEDNLRRVREKVMQLAREVEKMSGEEIPPSTFFPEFLTRVGPTAENRGGFGVYGDFQSAESAESKSLLNPPRQCCRLLAM